MFGIVHVVERVRWAHKMRSSSAEKNRRLSGSTTVEFRERSKYTTVEATIVTKRTVKTAGAWCGKPFVGVALIERAVGARYLYYVKLK